MFVSSSVLLAMLHMSMVYVCVRVRGRGSEVERIGAHPNDYAFLPYISAKIDMAQSACVFRRSETVRRDGGTVKLRRCRDVKHHFVIHSQTKIKSL